MFSLWESFRSALESIRAHGFRSVLTSLGIIIGVMSVIGVVSIVQGLSATVNAQFEGLAVGQTATDTFIYTLSDGNGGTDTATVTVTINGVNDRPTAADDVANVDEGATVNIAACSTMNRMITRLTIHSAMSSSTP